VGSTPFSDEMLTTEPPSTRCRPAMRTPRKVPVRLSSRILRKSAPDVSTRALQRSAGAVDQRGQLVTGLMEQSHGCRPALLVGHVELDEPGAITELFGQRLAAIAAGARQGSAALWNGVARVRRCAAQVCVSADVGTSTWGSRMHSIWDYFGWAYSSNHGVLGDRAVRSLRASRGAARGGHVHHLGAGCGEGPGPRCQPGVPLGMEP